MAGTAGLSSSAGSAREFNPVRTHPLTHDERARRGTDARKAVPPAQHAARAAARGRRDPVEILEEQGATRVPELVPIRHGPDARLAVHVLSRRRRRHGRGPGRGRPTRV